MKWNSLKLKVTWTILCLNINNIKKPLLRFVSISLISCLYTFFVAYVFFYICIGYLFTSIYVIWLLNFILFNRMTNFWKKKKEKPKWLKRFKHYVLPWIIPTHFYNSQNYTLLKKLYTIAPFAPILYINCHLILMFFYIYLTFILQKPPPSWRTTTKQKTSLFLYNKTLKKCIIILP